MRILCLLILTLSFLSHASAANEKSKLPSSVVVGTVYCDTCFKQELTEYNHLHFMPGASVSVQCGKMGLIPSFRLEAKTNEHGDFEVHLPFAVRENVKRIKNCQVKLISSNDPLCSVASMAATSLLHLKSRKQGIQIFSSGIFTFTPLKQPEFCYQKPSELSSVSDEKPVKPPLSFPSPTTPFLPSSPPFGLPLPHNPYQPPSPPSPPPPLINLPPLPPFPHLPPIPFITPPPPPPPPPVFSLQPFHFPSLPPLFHGIPPASPSK